MNSTLKLELAFDLIKQADLTGSGGALASLAGPLGGAIYGGVHSDKHKVRDVLGMTAGSSAGAVLGAASMPVLPLKVLTALLGSSVGGGMTARYLAKDNKPKWRKKLGL